MVAWPPLLHSLLVPFATASRKARLALLLARVICSLSGLPVSGHLLPSSSPSSSLCQRTSLELSRIAGAFSSRLLNSMKKKPICESTPVHLFLLRGRFRFFLRASHPRENNNPTNCSRAGCSPAESSGAAPLTRGLPLRQSSNTSRAMHYCSCASQPPLDMP